VGGVLGGTGEEPIRWTPDIVQPTLVHRVEPKYPEMARRARLQGTVFLEAVISTRGDVEDVKVLRSPSPLFDQEAINAVRQWKYTPALQNGRPVKIFFTIIVEFKLR
jgi:protein TonB